MKIICLIILFIFCLVVFSNAQPGELVEISKRYHRVDVNITDGMVYKYNIGTQADTARYFNSGNKKYKAEIKFTEIIDGTTPPPAETITTDIDNMAAVYSGTWVKGTSSGWHDNTLSYSNEVGATVEYTFKGKKVDVYSERLHTHGIIEILLDGVKVQDVDLYNATKILPAMVLSVNATEFNSTGGRIEHKLTIKVTGRKNTASTGTYGLSDYIKVYSTK